MYPTRRGRAVPGAMFGWLCAVAITLLLGGCGPRSAEGLYEQAVAKAKAGDLTGSMIDLKNALQKNDDYGPARRLLGEHYLRMGDPLSAIKELTRAQQLGESAAVTTPAIFRAQLDAGQSADVLKAISKLSADRMDAQIWALRAEALIETGDLKGAASALGNSLARDPNNADAHLGAARLAWASQDLQGARREYANAAKLAPNSPRGLLQQGEFEFGTGQVQAAATAFETALAKSFGLDQSKARLGLTRCLLATKDYDGAEKQLRVVIQQLPELPMAHYLLAYIEAQRRHWDAAEDHLLIVLKRAPDHLQSLMLKGAVNAEQKKYLQAEAAFNRVIAAMPGNLQARKLLANVYLREGQTAKAVEVLEVAPPGDATDARYQSLLGTALLNDGQTGKAVAAMRKAVELAPSTVESRMQLARGKLAAGDADGAIADLRDIATSMPDGAKARPLLVAVLVQQNRFDDALAEAQRVKSLTPNDASIYNLAAAAWIGKHDKVKAEAELQAALRLDPKFTVAKVNLAKLAVARKDFAAGARIFTQAMAEDPKSADAVLGMAALEIERKNEKAAVTLLESARSKWPELLEPRMLLAQLYARQGAYVRAEVPASEAVALQPTNVAAAALYGKILLAQNKPRPALDVLERVAPKALTDPGLQYDLAWARASVGDAKGSSEAANKAVAYSDRKSIPALLLAARLSLDQNRLDDARRDIAQIHTMLDPKAGAEAQSQLALLDGDMARAQKDWTVALASYERAFSLTPSSQTLGRVAIVLSATGRAQEARERLGAWLKSHPKDVNAQFRLADVQMTSGQTAAAVRSYEAVAAADDNDPVVHNNLAWLYLSGNDAVRGLASAEKAYNLARDNPAVMDTVAWLRFKSGNKSDEVVELLKSAAAATNNPEVRYHLAEVLSAQGKAAAARTELDAALTGGAQFSSRPAAQALRQRL